jgi:GNAT superfamily N-acetyltransferase
MQIRPFLAADAAACAALMGRALRQAGIAVGPGAGSTDAFLAAMVEEELVVAALNGAPTGFAAVYRPAAFVHHLYVDPARQRRGAGSALLAAAARIAGPGASLKCLVANRAARAFYRAQGWGEDDDIGGEDSAGPWIWIRAPRAD